MSKVLAIVLLFSISLTICEDLPKCPQYTCEKESKDTCASSHFNSTALFNSVNLTDNCGKEQHCYVSDLPYLTFTVSKEDIKGTCKNNTKPERRERDRFPGEDCKEDKECFVSDGESPQVTGVCSNGKCMGYNATQSCNKTSQCWVGHFCNKTDVNTVGSCAPQVKEGENCKQSWDCVNNRLCLKGKCDAKIHSISLGEKPEGDAAILDKYCELGFVHDGACSSLNATDAKDEKLESLTVCEFGSKCNYTYNGQSSFQRDCECGYNSNGQGYCPRGHDTNTNYWKSLTSKMAKNYDNKCHSLSRFDCYLWDDSVPSSLLSDKHKTLESHLYYNSVSCAQKVLSNGYISTSIYIMLALVALLI